MLHLCETHEDGNGMQNILSQITKG